MVLQLGVACEDSEVTGAKGSSLGKSGGGYSPMLGVRACRWARALDPLKATSQPD